MPDTCSVLWRLLRWRSWQLCGGITGDMLGKWLLRSALYSIRRPRLQGHRALLAQLRLWCHLRPLLRSARVFRTDAGWHDTVVHYSTRTTKHLFPQVIREVLR